MKSLDERKAEVAPIAVQLRGVPLPGDVKLRVVQLLQDFVAGSGCTETIKVPDTDVRVIVLLSLNPRVQSYVRVTRAGT